MSVAVEDVVIVGAGPTGLMLAAELCLAGVRPLLLERRPQTGKSVAKANGLGGHILDLLGHRGLIDRLEAAANHPRRPAQRFPFGSVQLDLTGVTDPPLRGMSLPQAELERVLDERARELGAEIRRGHEVVGLGLHEDSQDSVTVRVLGPEGPYQVAARYLVGCDGPRSRIRESAGIPFPGTTFPEVNRLAHVTLADSVTQFDNGDLEVPGLGLIRAGFTRTEGGVFSFGRRTVGELMVQVTEDEPAEVDDSDAPMTLAEFQDSIRRVLGGHLPIAEATRLTRYGFQARQVERYRHGRILLAGEAAHAFPATGVGLNVGMTDAVNLAWKLAADVRGWAPAGLLDTYNGERHYTGARTLMQTQAQAALRRGHDPAAEALRQVVQELLLDEQPNRRLGALIAGTDLRYPMPGAEPHALAGTSVPDLPLRVEGGAIRLGEFLREGRPVLLDLADRAELREAAGDWSDRVEIRCAATDARPADALLIRPDACIAWAAAVDQPADTAAAGLREALAAWFGAPARSADARGTGEAESAADAAGSGIPGLSQLVYKWI
jgi:2-polyprenyl-6-methoxyphenol hydroxylase-like FAD-dependent oxidoreductase